MKQEMPARVGAFASGVPTDDRIPGAGGPGGRLPPLGKIPYSTFERVIKPHLGSPRREVLVGPHHGVDTGVLDLGGGQVMALTTDPFFVVPEYGWERAAWFAVHIVASDAATSGLRPAYCAVDLNLPLEMSDDDLAAMWRAVDRACNEIGMAIVTGHTGRYEGCTYPMLGAATVMSVGPADQYLTAAMAAPGDAILMTKGAAIETTALFGVTFPDHLTRALGREVAQAAEALFYRMTVVEDALVAVEVGVRERGVTTLHDATERGVWGGLCDIADASGVGLLVDQDAILIRPETQAICDHFQIDPLAASSEGTLLLTCRQQVVSNLLDRLTDAGLDPRHIGEVTPKDRSVHVVRSGRERELERPEQDPFWPAYSKAWQEWRA